MLVEAAPKIGRRYVLAPGVDQEFIEAFINAPAHLGRPTRHQYAFLRGVMGADPAKEKVVVGAEYEFTIADEDFNHRFEKTRTERELTPEEVAEFVFAAQRVSKKSIQITSLREAIVVLRRLKDVPTSLDLEVGESGDTTLANFIADEQADDPANINDQIDLPEMVDNVLAGLPEREARILNMRSGRGYDHAMTLDEVGRAFGVTRERVRQIEARARRRAMPLFKKAGAQEYIPNLR